jgi:hypothetical protein
LKYSGYSEKFSTIRASAEKKNKKKKMSGQTGL